jgi:hypothetical protein
MTDPITPPPELVQQWDTEGRHQDYCTVTEHIAARAAQWGADQQLAKDAKWLDHNALNEPHLRITPVGKSLKEAMRPKLPSLKEQALKALEDDDIDVYLIRRALEALPND